MANTEARWLAAIRRNARKGVGVDWQRSALKVRANPQRKLYFLTTAATGSREWEFGQEMARAVPVGM